MADSLAYIESIMMHIVKVNTLPMTEHIENKLSKVKTITCSYHLNKLLWSSLSYQIISVERTA